MANPLDAPGGMIATWWKRLSRLPLGHVLFSRMIGRMVPYTGSLGARVVELEPGHSRWMLRDRRRVRNHLRSIHAIALANLAEVTGGTALLTALAPGVRGILSGLSMEYVKKARGTLTAESRCVPPDVLQGETARFTVHVEVRDEAGDVVARGAFEWLLKNS
ncbi:MAG TPA: hotdog fold domain-containing protein [Gemmatimonadaceae bacterium]|nr:hotdog fold domain-containing protein [Gemmatimonadaceae bacterium]